VASAGKSLAYRGDPGKILQAAAPWRHWAADAARADKKTIRRRNLASRLPTSKISTRGFEPSLGAQAVPGRSVPRPEVPGAATGPAPHQPTL